MWRQTLISLDPPHDCHVKAFRWYWYMQGIEIKTNGQRFDTRGNRIKPGIGLADAAKQYRERIDAQV